MQGLSGNMLLCLLILIGITSSEYSFYFFIVFLHWLFIWFTILHFLFFCSKCKSCPRNRKYRLWFMWRHSYKYVKMPAVHCISMSYLPPNWFLFHCFFLFVFFTQIILHLRLLQLIRKMTLWLIRSMEKTQISSEWTVLLELQISVVH